MRHEDRSRIEDIIRYIAENLDARLDLDTLAGRTHWSKYHFGRLFAAATGTTPVSYVNRKRMERAASELLLSDLPILEIALRCGFESTSAFNASFKKHYGQTPSRVRNQGRQNRNFEQFSGNVQEVSSRETGYDGKASNRFLRRLWEMNIRIATLPDLQVAYARHVGSYLDTWKAWSALGAWTSKHGLYPPERAFIGISLDDPATTEEQACRYDACVTLPEGFACKESADIGYRPLAGGLYAVYPFYDTIDRLGLAYQSLYGQWLPSSEYEADARNCLEFCLNDPSLDPEGKAKVDLHIPIKARTSV
jgi:DNA gyrase inhibitor